MFLYSVNCRASSDTPALWRPAADLAARFPHPTSDPPSHRPADAPPPPTPSRQHGRRLRTRGPHTATRNPPPRPPNGHAPRRCHPRPPSQRRWAPCDDLPYHAETDYYFFVKTKMSIFSGPVLLRTWRYSVALDDVRNLHGGGCLVRNLRKRRVCNDSDLAWGYKLIRVRSGVPQYAVRSRSARLLQSTFAEQVSAALRSPSPSAPGCYRRCASRRADRPPW